MKAKDLRQYALLGFALICLMGPAQASGQETPAGPAVQNAPAQPSAPEASAKPATPEAPSQPAAQEAPAQPVAQEVPAQPAVQETPAQPAAQEAPAQPVAQEAPAQPVAQETPAQPAAPEASAKPAAQETPAKVAQEKPFKQEELDQLLAPIALYPDNVLTQILIASTYPLEVVQAERWVKQNKSLKGDAFTTELNKQSWDDSVKALSSLPDVLTMMSEKLEWTQKLGDAFLAQQKDVMDTVQKLRKKATEAGNLKSSKEQEVKKEGDIIIIQSADPQVIYVPTYNPTVVYGAWWYPAYPPYPVYVYPPGAALFTFTMGIAIGAAWHGHGCYPSWHGGTVVVAPPRPPGGRPGGPGGVGGPGGPGGAGGPGGVGGPGKPGTKPGKPGTLPADKPGTKPGTGGKPSTLPADKPQEWKHNPEHRQGVAYKDSATRDKYTPTNRAAVDNRQSSRGYDRPGNGVSDRSQGQQKDRSSDRMSSSDRSRDNALSGMDRGGQSQRDSSRGSSSMSSSRSPGGPSGRASGGAPRGGGGGRGRR